MSEEKEISIPAGKWIGPPCTQKQPKFAPKPAVPLAVLPVELQNFHAAMQTLKDAWLARDLARIPELWREALAAAKAVQAWRCADSQRQDLRDAKRKSSGARLRQEARVIEQKLLTHPTWAADFLVTALGARMKPMLEYIAKVEDPAYAG